MESVEKFLKKCKESGDAAYSELRAVLERLENPKTRVDARRFLSHLQKHLYDAAITAHHCFSTYHFAINDIQLHTSSGFQQRKSLTMLVIPSIFMPEDWSFTFYEGLNRHPDSTFKDKIVAELGCGNGWITIAIAAERSPLKMYGLDINPRAVKISRINLFLNALDENGQPIYDTEKKTLLDRVEFHESDLLAYCRDQNIILETIVGCIPQILNPNPEAMTKMITENSSEDFLHSLSNYCALQGFVEDQFGLGLIAKAVEEGITAMKPTGVIIFNMGGRPGEAVCRRLFERRGFHVDKVWQTKVVQAADTDISALVKIEENSPHRFEFFKGLTGDQPLCARTAWAYMNAGGCISHSISVFSCQLRQPHQVRKIFEFLQDGFKEINNSLDLSFDNDAVAEEKILFLSYLSSVLKENAYLPFESPAGTVRFRGLVTRFMETYHRIPLTSKNVVVFPSRTAAIENAIRLFTPNVVIVDENLTQHLPRQWMTSLKIEKREPVEASADVVTVIEAPRQSDLMVELIKKLKPQVVVTGIANFEAVTSAAFENLLHVTREIGSRLFLDISDHFELSSLPSSNGILKYLAGNALPPHAAIACALLKNQVYTDLEVAFVISEDETILRALARSVELLEGSTSLISQYYYGCILHELVSFQLPDRRLLAKRESDDKSSTKLIGFASSVVSVFSNSELSITEEYSNSSLIRMDVDQSFLPLPSPVKAAIFESFARQNLSEYETDVTTAISQFIYTRYGYATNSNTQFLYSDYSLGLFNKLVLGCIQEGGTFCFPAGCNGNYVAAAKYLKADIMNIPTQADVGFKLTADGLSKVLASVKKPWLCISGPTISPTGLLYSNKEIEDILLVCAKFGARVVIDTSFSGLEYDFDNWDDWNLEPILSKLSSSAKSNFCVSLLGNLSLDLLTGGLTFAFLAMDQSLYAVTSNSFAGLTKPHVTTRYTIRKLLAQAEQEAGYHSEFVEKQKRILKDRSQRLNKTLQRCGWEVLPSCGGVSMVARPSGYLGKHAKLKDNISQKIELTDSTIREAILTATGLCINSDSWTGIPGYCRFTIALQEDKFAQALDCIENFYNLVE